MIRMMESKSYYFPNERAALPYGWCAKLIIHGADHGCIGFESKKSAQEWLDNNLNAIKQGRIHQGGTVKEAYVYKE
jgi:hypothetical protein